MDQVIHELSGDPVELRATAEQWGNSVGNPLSDVTANIELGKLEANVEWDGRAAEAYKAIVPSQSEGLSSIRDLAGQMRTSLYSLADAIESFWVAFGFGVIGFVVGVGVAIASIWGVVTTPAGIAAALIAANTCITLISIAMNNLKTYFHTIDTEQRTLQQKAHDLGAQWARSNSDMSDGNVSDGDSSDWRVNS